MKDKDGLVLFSLSGKWVSWCHTFLAYCGFIGALAVGLKLHFHKIVKNEFFGYPEEWFPSVSATIGDRYPERSIFQVFIAINSGPRFALVFLWYLLTRRSGSFAPKFVAVMGLIRTLLCGGWVYITSTDDHDWHDIFMISYLIFTLPWTVGCLSLSPNNVQAIKYRKMFAAAFFSTLVPLIYYFIQHKVHRVAGAYTKYAFFEWSLILFDVGFDAVTALDFLRFEFRIVDVNGVGKGNPGALADVVAKKSKSNQKEVVQLLGVAFSWNAMLDSVADVYSGFMFWSILTSLGVTVWYFPLWHMGISGYEALIMSTMSPYLLSNGSLRRLITKHIRLVSLLSLVGFSAFLLPNPTQRLFATAIGVFFACLSWAATIFVENSAPERLDAKIYGFSLGLIASSVAKFACHSNNPVWPIMNDTNGGWNKTGLVLGLLAVLRSTRKGSQRASDLPSVAKQNSGSFLVALGLAGLLFALHSLLSDSGTMITWVWNGYPVKGPLPVPHGAYTLLAMAIGVLIGMARENWFRSWPSYLIGSVSAAIFYCNTGWTGYYGALMLSIYLMASIPPLIKTAAQYAPGSTFGHAFLLYNVLVLAHVWVVAYAFVPGGPLLRERTNLVLGATMLCIGAGVHSFAHTRQPVWHSSRNDSPIRRRVKSYAIYILTGLELFAAAVAYMRFPSFDYAPYNKEEKIVTAGIWTVHFALDNDMWSSERRIRDLIRDMELDVVGLLESDLQRIIMGNRDMTQFLAEDLGMYADYGPGPNKHTWGATLLSKFPIINSTHHLLPSPVGELAPAILATLDMYGTLVDVLVFHSGQEEDWEDRRLQSLEIAKLMGDSPRPLILLSYLVTKPLQGNYNTYVSDISRMKDIDPSDWDRWCEYILYRGIKRIGYARVSRSTITDTELQVGKFVVSENTESTNEIIPEDKVPPGMRFPSVFKGQGVRGHAYHVFNEPRYYI